MVVSIIRKVLFAMVLCGSTLFAQSDIKHVKVYYEPGRYGGWPANNGVWIWENEILVGLNRGYWKDNGIKHNIDREKEEQHVFARSTDGGESWKLEDPSETLVPQAIFGVQRTDRPLQVPAAFESSMDFTNPNFAMTVRMRKDLKSSLWYSYDKGKTWKGPYTLPEASTNGDQIRTDYIVDGKSEALMFGTAMKTDGKEGRVMVLKTTNGGKDWKFLSWVGEEPKGYSIMPASVRLSKKELLVTLRHKDGDRTPIQTFYSKDNGKSWVQYADAVADTGIGNPPAMVTMKDGRICLVYGFRSDPDGTKTSDMRARFSSDKGKTWSNDLVLRTDGSGRDIGYPRLVQRPDGKLVTMYYFMDKQTGPERYIGATIFSAPQK